MFALVGIIDSCWRVSKIQIEVDLPSGPFFGSAARFQFKFGSFQKQETGKAIFPSSSKVF